MKKNDDNPAKSTASATGIAKDGRKAPDADAAAPHPVRNLPAAAVSNDEACSLAHKILMSSLNSIYIQDLKTTGHIFINPEYSRLTGYTLADLQTMGGAKFFTLFHPQDQERIAAHLKRLSQADDDEILEIEYRFKTADGRWIWCLSRDTVFERNGQGCVRKILGTWLDISDRKSAAKELEIGLRQSNDKAQRHLAGEITERKRAEEALRKARHDLKIKIRKRTAQLQASVTSLEKEIQARKVLENQLRQWSRVFMDAADPIIIEDMSGIIIDMNRQAEREYGWCRHELIGKSIRSLIPSARYTRADRLRGRCRRGEEVRNWEGLRQDQKGRILSVLVTAFPLLGESGKIVCLATIAKDITRRKQVERELENSRRYLRQLSRRSIEALENDRRTTAKELHDSIGASLAAIKFRMEATVEEVVQKPKKAADSLHETIFHLQAAIKETKQISANLRPTILDDLGLLSTITWYMRQFTEQFSHINLIRQIEIPEEDIPDTLKIVIYRALQESLHNVAKHSEATEVCIGLKSDSDRIVLEISDNGSGFDFPKILGRRDPMSGYGLASIQERAEIVGGNLTIDSAPEKGTRIRMILPRAPYASKITGQPPSGISSSGGDIGSPSDRDV